MSEEKSPKITLRDYISAKRPIIYINSFDFEAVDAAIKNSVEGIFQKEYAIAEYSPATGKANFQTKDPCERKIIIDGKVIAPSLGDFLRDFISSQYEEISKETIVVLKEVHDCLDDPSVYSALQTIAYKKNSSKDEEDNYYRITIIIVDSQLRIPSELEKIITVVDFPRPGIEKIKEIIKEELDKNYFDLPEDAILKDLAMRLSSFSEVEIKQLIRQILVKDQRLTEDSFKLVTEEKRQIIKKTGLLELIDVEGKVELQDFELFVEYIKNKAKIFKNLPDAKEFGVDAPSGVMLVGMPGCGKSLSATCVAKEFGCSLLKLDIGRMFGKYVGESEGNLRKAIRAAEAASPCVLWIDEIEKGFSGVGGNNSEQATRMFGYFLTWMQEKTCRVYVFATANNISNLPPEFTRRGRFDEIFRAMLPKGNGIKAIFEGHLKKRNQDLKNLDLWSLAKLCEGEEYSGADIESMVKSAVEQAYLDHGRRVTQKDLEQQIENTTSSFKSDPKKYKELLEKLESLNAKPVTSNK